MANRTFKREKRLALLFLIIMFLMGSAVWLKLILMNTLSEQLQHVLLYEREQIDPTFHVADGLNITAALDNCIYSMPPPPPPAAGPTPDFAAARALAEIGDPPSETPKCGKDNAIVNVTATLDHIYSPVSGLYLVLYASLDFETWWQANDIDYQVQFKLDPLTNEPIGVSTYACVGSPGFVYLVGCLHEGLLSSKLFSTKTKPPFADCIAMTSTCGASCHSGALEPTANDPSRPDRYHKPADTHCVTTEPVHEKKHPSKWAPQDRVAPKQGEQGVIRIDDLEQFGQAAIGLQPASYVFAVMYVLGVVALFLMYVPGIGQREGVSPQWLRLKQTICKGTVRMKPGAPPPPPMPSEGARNGGANGGANGGPAAGARPTRAAPTTQAEPLLAAQPKPQSNGITACLVSISASESANIILRNGLGKIVGNLRLMLEMGDTCATDVTVIDTFVDEGHRVGAYYLYRSMCLTFYVCIKRPHALRIASDWLRDMNKSDAGENTDVFDKADLFKLLDEKTRDRSEIKLLQLMHSMFKVLNQFGDKIDPLFDKMLAMPVFDTERQARASEFLKEHAQLPPILETDVAEDGPLGGSGSSNDLDSDAGSTVDFEPDEKRVHNDFIEKFGFKNPKAAGAVLRVMRQEAGLLRSGELFSLARCLDVTIRSDEVESMQGGAGGAPILRDSMRPPSTEGMKRNFFHPVLWSKLGHMIVNGYEGNTKDVGDRSVPTDVSSYLSALKELGKCGENVLDSTAWVNLRPLFKGKREREAFVAATSRKHLAFDHIENVLSEVPPEHQHQVMPMRSSGQGMTLSNAAAAPPTSAPMAPQTIYVRAMYVARGNPTKWQPWTRNNHRRVIQPGVWIAPKPKRVLRSHDEVRDRRELAKEFWAARKKVGLLEAGQRVHFYTDDVHAEEMEDPIEIDDLNKYECLNTHLGKAGGLNFGLQASVYSMFEEGLPAPSPTRPFFFAIIDARHSTDERLWLNVLPPFFTADERAAVTFNPSVCLVQLAHSYLGMKHATDVLDMANDFLFTGMAVIRNQSYGMTSCGTGGVWSITSARQLGEFFYGRTMIEDSASSLEHFLKGRKSVYVAPYAGKKPEQQLMCAVPKVSANYLEALERWDTGAVQCLCAQGLGRPWFWITLSCILLLITAMLAPAMLPTEDLQEIKSLADLSHIFANLGQHPFFIVLLFAIVMWTSFIAFSIIFALFFTSALNFTMRMLVLFFNVTYPFNSVSSIFWIIIPPWICLAGKFPFRFQPVVAIAGSLALRIIEWLIVLKTKKESERNGSHLYEYSIFRSQQMNEVTVPIKLRACFKGLSTGWDDVFGKKDNSFWVSFGTAQAVQWVQAWLSICMLAMFAALVGGIVNLIIHRNEPDVIAACAFGMVLACIQIWILWEPAFYVLKGRTIKMSLRHTEVLVLLAIGAFVIFAASSFSTLALFSI